MDIHSDFEKGNTFSLLEVYINYYSPQPILQRPSLNMDTSGLVSGLLKCAPVMYVETFDQGTYLVNLRILELSPFAHILT